MSNIGAVVLGSGLSGRRNDIPRGDGVHQFLRGDQVILINPEDASANGPVASQRVEVGVTATNLPSGVYTYRRAIAIFNNGTATLFIGDENVSIAQGFPIPTGQSMSFDLKADARVYGISSAPIDVRVLEVK
jgi:hypothetical protein